MDDNYLSNIQNRVRKHEGEVKRLVAFKSNLLNEVNKLKTEREQGKVDIEKFVSREVNYSSEKIREAREHAEIEIGMNKAKIKDLNRKGVMLVKLQRELSAEKANMDVIQRSLKAWENDVEMKMQKVQHSMLLSTHVAEEANKNRDEAVREKIRNRAISNETEMALQEFKEFNTEKRRVMEQKEYLIGKEYKILKAKQELLDNGIKWVDSQKLRITSQWQQLLAAKEYINNHK